VDGSVSQKRTTLGVDWNHEYAIQRWESERSHKPERGPLERYQNFRSRFVRSQVFRELSGIRDRRYHRGLVTAILPRQEHDASVLPEDPDERLRLVLGVLDQLDPKMRTILTLSLKGRSLRSIARQLGCSAQWVSQLRRRAMCQVREALVRAGVVKRIRPYTTREML